MKLIYKNLKKGEIKFKVENNDDLWYLSHIIEKGDIVKGKTTRKIDYGKGEKVRAEKKLIFLVVSVETVEFHKHSNILRVLGKVVEGPEEVGNGSYHTFELDEGVILSLVKQKWLKYQINWLDEAIKSKVAKILICVLDRENAYFALSKKYGYELLSSLEGEVQKKEERAKTGGQFYVSVIGVLKEYLKRHKFENIVVASPAFFKEDLIKLIKDENLKKKIVLASCSNVGENGINEVLKRPAVEQVLKQDRIAKEIKMVETVLSEISKDGLFSYGVKEVENALNAGAIKILLICDQFIQEKRREGGFEKIDKIMKTVEDMKGEIHIIGSEHEGGKKLSGLGGIAAILRYKLNY
ncbi:mRNA surveillance protein pelota [Candidatus Woesearchaeota archaeon]|nr:mRNA surveillance protein pelota [Candidatus Woesearchaeota archaeon]